jgi:hypothetical protein
MLRKISLNIVLLILVSLQGTTAIAQFPRFSVLAFYSKKVEPDHVDFALVAIKFFKDLTIGNGFVFVTTSNMADLNDEKLKGHSLVMWINDFPRSQTERDAFRRYMENGGGWFGFHVSAYNDKDTKWPWLNEFLGCGIFYRNSWPPMPAKLYVDDNNHPARRPASSESRRFCPSTKGFTNEDCGGGLHLQSSASARAPAALLRASRLR